MAKQTAKYDKYFIVRAEPALVKALKAEAEKQSRTISNLARLYVKAALDALEEKK